MVRPTFVFLFHLLRRRLEIYDSTVQPPLWQLIAHIGTTQTQTTHSWSFGMFCSGTLKTVAGDALSGDSAVSDNGNASSRSQWNAALVSHRNPVSVAR